MRVLVWILKRLQDVLIKIWIAQFLALGVAYVVWSDRAEGPYRPTDFAVDLVIAMKQLGVPGLPEIPGLDTLPTGRPAPARAAPPPSLADALPPAPEGWTLRGWQGSDAAVLASAGAALPVEAHGRAVELVLAFEAVMQGATPGLVATYARDADRIVVMIREAPAEPAPAPSSAAPLTVHGVGFEPLGPTADGAGFNALSARIAGTFAVDALANTDMATLAGLLADHALEVADHQRIGIGPHHRADDVVGRADVGDPVAQRPVDRVLEGRRAALHRPDLGAEEAHADDVEGLAGDVLGAHVDDAGEAEVGAGGRRGDAVLAGAGLGDDPRLAEALGEEHLADAVVDLVRPRVTEVLALEVDLAGADGRGEARRRRQGGRAADVVAEDPAVLRLELGVGPGLGPLAGELLDGGHEGLGDVAAAELAEVSEQRRRACVRVFFPSGGHRDH